MPGRRICRSSIPRRSHGVHFRKHDMSDGLCRPARAQRRKANNDFGDNAWNIPSTEQTAWGTNMNCISTHWFDTANICIDDGLLRHPWHRLHKLALVLGQQLCEHACMVGNIGAQCWGPSPVPKLWAHSYGMRLLIEAPAYGTPFLPLGRIV